MSSYSDYQKYAQDAQSRGLNYLNSVSAGAELWRARQHILDVKKRTEAYKQRFEDAQGLAAGPRTLSGEFMVNAAGEAETVVDFPVKFLEKPLISFGFEMKTNVIEKKESNQSLAGEVYIRGQMASATALVLDWRTEERPPLYRFYTGFSIGAVSTGPTFQKMIGVWTVIGTAIPDPMDG